MYYNPETQEKLSRTELKARLNVSFPKNVEEVSGWYLLHNGAYPAFENGQSVVPATIELVDGKYVQTFSVIGSAVPFAPTVEERLDDIEDALIELAEIIGGE